MRSAWPLCPRSVLSVIWRRVGSFKLDRIAQRSSADISRSHSTTNPHLLIHPFLIGPSFRNVCSGLLSGLHSFALPQPSHHPQDRSSFSLITGCVLMSWFRANSLSLPFYDSPFLYTIHFQSSPSLPPSSHFPYSPCLNPCCCPFAGP